MGASQNLFSYYQQLQENYAGFRGCFPTLPVIRANDGLLAWEGGGYIKVATANNVKTGRSFSLRYLHLSEFAFWRDPKTLMTGLMQSVPDDPDTVVVIESTANGVGGEFHRLWLDACDPTSDSEWIAVFFAWWEHPEYVLEPADPAAFQASLTAEETTLRDTYSLTLAQLCWRRWAIRNKCSGSLDSFKQEYPSNPEEAFLFSGRPRFSHEHLNRMPGAKRDAATAGTCGELIEEYNGPKSIISFLPQERGALVVYKRPAPGHQYVIGFDIAEGIDALESGGDPDYSVGCVLDQVSGEQVAKLRGRIEPGPFADYADVLARWYNWAYLVPEANGPGIAFLEGLIRNNYPPSLIYHRRPQPDEQFSDGNHTLLSHLGWKTSAVTRVQLIAKHDTNIRQFALHIVDPGTLGEHLWFVVKPNGKAEAKDETHDDEVIACALAGVGLETAPPDRSLAGVRKLAPPGASTGGTVKRYGKRQAPADRGVLVRF